MRSAIATTAVVVALAACSSDSGTSGGSAAGSPSRAPQESGPVTMKVLAFNDYMPEDIPKQFKQLTGNDIEITYTSSNEDAIAKIQAAGPGAYDIAWITSPFVQGLIKAGGLEQLDAASIPNLSNLYPEASQLQYDPGNQYSAPYSWGTTGICYRKDLVKNTTIDGWDDLLEPSAELDGKVTLIDEDRWILEPALKTLGFSINTTDPDELQQAVDKTIAAKDHLLGFDGETFYAKLVSGEALAVQGWDGWCNYGTAEDPNVVYVQPKEGSDLWVDTMVIPKGSTHVEQAQDFINFILEPENQQWVAENILYKVPNQKSMEALDPAFLDQFPNMKMTPQELLQIEAMQDLGEGVTTFSDAVTQVKNG
jgi:spermidine/putrescine transport system substrate-binding protein